MSETAAASSQRQIVFSTAIMGSASAVGLILSLIRTKVFALLLGPAGIGLLGLLNNLLSSAALLAGLGVGTSGVRHVAEAAASEDRPAIARARAVLFAMTGALALIGGALLWLLREPIARHLLGDPALSGMVGWLALGLAFTLAAGAQVALLNGMRRVADLARLQVAGALAATVVGIAAVAVWGAQALVAVVIAVPLTAFVVGAWFVRRLRLPREAVVARELAREGLKLARLGLAFMVAQLVISGGLLAIRAHVKSATGLDGLGQFEAAWLISSVYLGAVLSAMTTDFYPRLSALTADPAGTRALVNDQTRVALWLCGPVCLGLIGLAPLATHLLFSARFEAAADVLRLQVIGDILKVMAWPLGFVLLARGDGLRYVLAEATAMAAFVAAVWIGLPRLGLPATGLGFILMYVAYLPVVRALVRRHLAFDWDADIKRQAVLLLAAAVVTAVAGADQPLLGATLGLTFAAVAALVSLRRLRALLGALRG